MLKRTFRIGFVLMLNTLVISSALAQRSKKIARIEKRLQSVMELSNCPGMAVAVVEKDKLTYVKGFGYKDYENKEKVSPNTLFAIGSCTKAFTASILGKLEGEEKLDMDASPIDYIPELKFYNDEMNRNVTVRDMLSHKTGLPRHDYAWYFFPSNSRDTLVSRLKYHEPTLEVREGFQYNNFMYMLAGAVGERLYNQSWEENVNEHIFKPLGMAQSNFHIDELEKAKDVAFGYSYSKSKGIHKEDYYRIRGMAPAGSINSSAREMANWAITWINGGKFNDQQVIPQSFVNEAMGSQAVVSSRVPGKKHPSLHMNNYGFGWFVSSYRGHYRVEHGGNIDGFSANVAFYPSDSIGVIVLVNQNNSRVPSTVRNIVVDKLLGLSSGDWDESLKKSKKKKDQEEETGATAVSNRIAGTTPSHPLKDYVGSFNFQGYGTLKVRLEQDSLMAYFPDEKVWLRHLHYDVFEPFSTDGGIDTNSSSGLMFNFQTNNAGDISSVELNVEQGLDPIPFNKEIELIEVDASDLEIYVGDYDLGGALAKIFLKEDKLKLFVPGQPEYLLQNAGEHKFVIDGLEGYSVEFELKDSKVEALMFIQPNGNFRVPKKQSKKEEAKAEAGSADDLEMYVGEYDLGGAMAKIFLKNDELKLFVPGQPEYLLKKSGEHKFAVEGLDGFGVEFELKDDKVTAMMLIQPDGSFRVPKK